MHGHYPLFPCNVFWLYSVWNFKRLSWWLLCVLLGNLMKSSCMAPLPPGKMASMLAGWVDGRRCLICFCFSPGAKWIYRSCASAELTPPHRRRARLEMHCCAVVLLLHCQSERFFFPCLHLFPHLRWKLWSVCFALAKLVFNPNWCRSNFCFLS